MRTIRQLLSVIFLSGALAGISLATTWAPQEFTCPIDGEKNTFQAVMSYGSYIYMWPSKYQWLFWPNTESQTFYMCKKCHLTTFMWDFDKLPKDKLPEIKKILAGITVSKTFKEYNEIPVTERLEVLEKVYSVLGKDDDFWENFNRIKGYHYGKIGEAAKAADARKKSLATIQKKLANDKDSTPKKLLLYMSAAMKHFLGDDAGSLADLEKALVTKYADNTGKPKDAADAEKGLNERITDYITRIKSEKDKPRLFDKFSTDEH